jgi:hypothetical protein
MEYSGVVRSFNLTSIDLKRWTIIFRLRLTLSLAYRGVQIESLTVSAFNGSDLLGFGATGSKGFWDARSRRGEGHATGGASRIYSPRCGMNAIVIYSQLSARSNPWHRYAGAVGFLVMV